MLTKVNVEVSSTVTLEGDPIPETAKESAHGYIKHTKDEGVVLLSYKTVTDGAAVTTELFPEKEALRLVRRGAIESEIVFREGESHSSLYRIPPYAFDMTVETKRLSLSLSPFGGEVALVYSMTVGGAKKECTMRITVRTA